MQDIHEAVGVGAIPFNAARLACHSEGALATEESAKNRGAATKGKFEFNIHRRNLPVYYFQTCLVDPSVA